MNIIDKIKYNYIITMYKNMFVMLCGRPHASTKTFSNITPHITCIGQAKRPFTETVDFNFCSRILMYLI